MASRQSFSTTRCASGLLARRFRNRLILHAFDKMARSRQSRAAQRGLPAGNRALSQPLPLLFRHSRISVTSYSPPSVTACTHSR
jgi:hypothetical protein